uniref:Nuclear receptor domain-containing protein n=1 Tax=Steinernema glaseri TaxID=37863 RepID=A0A1I7YY94_9BILA
MSCPDKNAVQKPNKRSASRDWPPINDDQSVVESRPAKNDETADLINEKVDVPAQTTASGDGAIDRCPKINAVETSLEIVATRAKVETAQERTVRDASRSLHILVENRPPPAEIASRSEVQIHLRRLLRRIPQRRRRSRQSPVKGCATCRSWRPSPASSSCSCETASAGRELKLCARVEVVHRPRPTLNSSSLLLLPSWFPCHRPSKELTCPFPTAFQALRRLCGFCDFAPFGGLGASDWPPPWLRLRGVEKVGGRTVGEGTCDLLEFVRLVRGDVVRRRINRRRRGRYIVADVALVAVEPALRSAGCPEPALRDRDLSLFKNYFYTSDVTSRLHRRFLIRYAPERPRTSQPDSRRAIVPAGKGIRRVASASGFAPRATDCSDVSPAARNVVSLYFTVASGREQRQRSPELPAPRSLVFLDVFLFVFRRRHTVGRSCIAHSICESVENATAQFSPLDACRLAGSLVAVPSPWIRLVELPRLRVIPPARSNSPIPEPALLFPSASFHPVCTDYPLHHAEVMASGSQPSSQQRNAVSQRNAKPRSTGGRGAVPISDFCVVCGDRACSHHYYGVAACHGCKCFFWRSVKSKAEYVCRYNGNCEIDINGRNACRSCRFNRCLKAGMQPEAVRPQKTPLNDTQKANRAGNKRAAKFEDHDSDGSHFDDRDMSASPPNTKKVRLEQVALVNSFMQVQKLVDEGEHAPIKNECYTRIDSLVDAFENPTLLDIYRSKITYQIRLQRVTAEEMYDCRRRTLVSAFDWIRMIGNIERIATTQDKMCLLKNSYAPLTIFDMSVRTSQTTTDPSLLCLPTGITVSKNEDTVSNCFLSKTLIENILDTLTSSMGALEMDEMEVAMMKAILVLNSGRHFKWQKRWDCLLNALCSSRSSVTPCTPRSTSTVASMALPRRPSALPSCFTSSRRLRSWRATWSSTFACHTRSCWT